MASDPTLHNNTGHSVVPTCDRWSAILDGEGAKPIGGDARYQLWHSETSSKEDIQMLAVPTKPQDDGSKETIKVFFCHHPVKL